jgi:FkbM family methyltransferase
MQVKRLIKRELRDLQSMSPGLRNAKISLYNFGTRYAGLFVDQEFKLLSHLKPCRLALDIGGNWGQSVLALQRYAAPERVITFEPNPELSQRLRATFASDATVQVESVALGDASGQFDLHIPKYRNYIYDGLASLDREKAELWINPRRMARFDPKKITISTHTVNVARLDDFDLTPDIIKMDVQGMEDAVARGGLETIRRGKPAMIVEDPSRDFAEIVAECGLRPYTWNGSRLLAESTGRNVMFLTEAQRAAIP